MATKPMQVARYFCTGEIEDRRWRQAPVNAPPQLLCSPRVGTVQQDWCNLLALL